MGATKEMRLLVEIEGPRTSTILFSCLAFALATCMPQSISANVPSKPRLISSRGRCLDLSLPVDLRTTSQLFPRIEVSHLDRIHTISHMLEPLSSAVSIARFRISPTMLTESRSLNCLSSTKLWPMRLLPLGSPYH